MDNLESSDGSPVICSEVNDLRNDHYEDLVIPLKTGLNMRELSSGTELVLKDDEADAVPQEDSPNYFNNEELLKNLNSECLYYKNKEDNEDNSEEECNDNKSPFEEMMKKMTPLVENEVFKKELKAGFGRQLPNKAFVTIHYNAYLEYSDEPFDSSRLRNSPLKFVIGDGRAVEGLDMGVATMKKGEISQFLIKSTYAFGKLGCPPRIPPEAMILYEVELLNFLNSAPAIEYEGLSPEERKQLSFKEILNVAKSEHEAGNDYFSRDNYYKALNKYKKATRLIDNISVANEEDDNERNNWLLKLYLNISLCYLKQRDYKLTVIYAKKVLNIDPNNTKGNYRCGKAFRHLGDFSESKKHLIRARNCSPSDKDINNELKALSNQEIAHLEFEKKFSENIFNKNSGNNINKTPKFKYEVNEQFKALVTDRLKILINNDCLQEIPFPSGSSPSEISCIKHLASEFGLFYEEQNHGSSKKIKVTKSNPSN